MKIAFVGTCQVHGMAAVARRLLPDADVVSYHLNAPHRMEEIDRLVSDADVGITQFADQLRPDGSELPLSRAAFLNQQTSVAVYVPTVAFTGFHPDICYVFDGRTPVDGVFGHYHSQLSLAGYLSGLDVDRTVALFNAHVFAELGYFDAYDLAEGEMLRTFVRHGFHLTGMVRRWRARGEVFMHSHNHPTIAFLGQLAVMALAQAGLVEPRSQFGNDVPDKLGQSVVVPVYAPLARRLGVSGSDSFLRPSASAPVAARRVPLATYVARSFELYRNMDAAKLRGSSAEAAIAKVQTLLA